MAMIPSGQLEMGSTDGEADERPVHTVQLNAFCLDLSEVTVAQYEACVKDKSCPPAASKVDWTGVQPHDLAAWSGFCNAGKPDRASHPINCVTHSEAHAYCKHQEKRVPSEEEWEYAARGSEGRMYPWGNQRPGETLLNACGLECSAKAKLLDLGLASLFEASDGFVGTAPVRSFPAGRTPQGVFDLGGNVSEWTSSPYCPYPGSNCSDDHRATRGSAWTSDEMRETRATARRKEAQNARLADLGFRCAK
jgi:formylglycine-generating enzyme required for sulfatase activity